MHLRNSICRKKYLKHIVLSFLGLAFSFPVIAENIKSEGQLLIKHAWSDAVVGENAIYGCKDGVRKDITSKLILETPTPLILIPKAFNLAVEFSAADAKKIANRCKAKYRNQFDQVGCISRGVNIFFKDKTFTGVNSSCRSHAFAFDQTFAQLNIPRSTSVTMGVQGKFYSSCDPMDHVVNRVVLVSDSGQPYAYVIDSGWFPQEAFPLTKFTADYHKGNPNYPAIQERLCPEKRMPQSGLVELFLHLVK